DPILRGFAGNERHLRFVARLTGHPGRAEFAVVRRIDELDRPRRALQVPIGSTTVRADLLLPPRPKGLVIFVHGSAGNRSSPRSRAIADHLERQGFGTLLLDLLSREEDAGYAFRYAPEQLADRLAAAHR